MPLIDDLRAHWFTNGCEEYQRRAADALENLVRYASHHDDCQIMTHGVWSDPIPCTCGLTALLKEIGGE